MPTPKACLDRAEEAERLAAVVSYARDREQLTRQALEWRERAAELAAAPPKPCTAAEPPSLVARLRQGIRRRPAAE